MTKSEKITALFLFFTVFFVYLYTITPTLPFWDCGEFISCSYTLGVPHPPGTPLMILIGNMFVKLFFFIKEVALRVNLFAAISSSLSAVFVYMIMLKIFLRINTTPSIVEKFINSFVSFLAAITGAFFYSFWQSSVEAEVYTPSTLIILFIVWLALTWYEKLDDENDDRFVFLVIYISILSIGIHMLPLLALPGALSFFIILTWKKHFNLSLSLIGFAVFFTFLYLGMTKEKMFLVLVGAFLSGLSIVILDYKLDNKKVNYKKVFTYLGIYILLLLISISTYAVLYIRAKHNPYINIAAPVTLKELWDVFNRKQYGPMILLPRKTDNGIGTIPALFEQFKMFFRYYSWQFGAYFRGELINPNIFQKFISAFLMAVVTATGLFGIWGHFKRDKKTFLIVFITFALLSAGLVVYLNLKYSPSDPIASHDPREVRERDYFYAPSYFFFMLFFAFGLKEIIMSFKKKTKESINKLSVSLFSPQQLIIMLLILVVSISPFFANINSNANRRNNWIADEYAKNLLMTPMPNSIIFTNGDNDTYPLWFEQTVKHYRYFDPGKSGVMVVNLSLLNVNWYIKQMKSFGVPISMSDKQIDELVPVRISSGEVLMIRDIVIRDIICTTAGIKATRKILYSSGKDFRDSVLSNYKADSVNVYFSVTVSESAKQWYKKNLILEGLAQRVVSNEEAQKYPGYIDLEKTYDKVYNQYQYKYILDPKIHKDDNIDRIMTNYASGFLQMGVYYAQQDSLEKAVDLFVDGRKFYVFDKTSVTMNIISILLKLKEYDRAIEEINEQLKMNLPIEKSVPLKIMLANVYTKQEKYDNALAIYKEIQKDFPNEGAGYAGELKILKLKQDTLAYNKLRQQILLEPNKIGSIIGFLYMEHSDKELLLEFLNLWLKARPNDMQAQQLKDEVLKWDNE